MIKENSDCFVVAKRFNDFPSGAFPVYRDIPAERSIAHDQFVDSWIVDLPDDEAHRVSHNRMRKCAQFPGANVGGQANDSASPSLAFKEMLQSLMKNKLTDIASVQ